MTYAVSLKSFGSKKIIAIQKRFYDFKYLKYMWGQILLFSYFLYWTN